jgi:hypothetical protein
LGELGWTVNIANAIFLTYSNRYLKSF